MSKVVWGLTNNEKKLLNTANKYHRKSSMHKINSSQQSKRGSPHTGTRNSI